MVCPQLQLVYTIDARIHHYLTFRMSFYRLNLANKAGQQIPNVKFLIAQYCDAESKVGQNLQYYRHINVHN